MNNIELNAILYYADFLSMRAISLPVTDNCKYFFIHGAPINSAFILELEPLYDEYNVYFILAKTEYEIIKKKFGEDGIASFIEDICSIRACGSVNGDQMLTCIHLYSDKKLKINAFKTYHLWKNNQKYTHITINEDGKKEEKQCSRYVYHVERMLDRRKVFKGAGTYTVE